MKTAILQMLFLLSCSLLMRGQTGNAKRIAPIEATAVNQFNATDSVGVAILAGVGKYPAFSNLGPLRYPGSDVDRIAAVLRTQRYVVITVKDSEATKGSILNAITQAGDAIAAEIKAGKRLNIIFFFSGHGFAVKKENYLAAYDATANDLDSSGLAVKRVEDALSKTGASRRVLWIDACRNEPGKGVGDSPSLDVLQTSEGTRALLSTKAGHLSYEDDELKQGLFTYYLVKGLQGDAAKSDGLVTFQDLASYVTLAVRARSLASGHVQVPYEAGEATGDFLLARLAGKVVPADRPAESSETAPSSIGTGTPAAEIVGMSQLKAELESHRRSANAEKAWWTQRKPSIGSFRIEIQTALDGLDDHLRQAETALSSNDTGLANSALHEMEQDLSSLRAARGAR